MRLPSLDVHCYQNCSVKSMKRLVPLVECSFLQLTLSRPTVVMPYSCDVVVLQATDTVISVNAMYNNCVGIHVPNLKDSEPLVHTCS